MTKRRKPKHRPQPTSRLLLTPERIAGATVRRPDADLIDQPRKKRRSATSTKGQADTRSAVIYAVFAQVRQGVSHDFLAAYSTPTLAQDFIQAQDEQLRQCLVTWEVEIDKHPSDPFWAEPHRMAAAFHIVAGLPGDTLSGGRSGEQIGDDTAPGSFDEIMANARERGRELLDAWVAEGVLVDASEASGRRANVAHLRADEVVTIRHRETVYHLACVLDLPVDAIARVNRALGNATASQRLLWWRNPHGALGGITAAEAIRKGRLRRCVELARGYADEHVLGSR